MRHLGLLLLLVLSLGAGAAAAGRSPLSLNAERTFFHALNEDASQRKAALRQLTTAVAVDSLDGRSNLLLGLCHLWIAAEGSRADPEVINHVILAEHYLARAQKLAPSDQRIPSWLVPTQIALGKIEQRPEDADRLFHSLLDAYELDPAFHSFSVALLSFDSPRESERFRTGLEALRTAMACPPDNPVCANRPQWPHNVEAFSMFVADYEMKVGDVARARAALENARTSPAFDSWRHAGELTDRLANVEDYAARYANADPEDDPPAPRLGCAACHAK